jgi:hypothetical protein
MGNHPLPGYGSVTSGDRLVRTRLLGGVGAGGEIPLATRLLVQQTVQLVARSSHDLTLFVSYHF